MSARTGGITALIAVLLFLACGCTGTGPGTTVTPTATETPPITAQAATAPPTPTVVPEPFPGALTLKQVYLYGNADVACEATIYRAFFRDEYEWWSPQWGRYWNTTPSAGNKFLFVFIRFVNRGTTQAILPSSGKFAVHADGAMYRYYAERDHSLPIKGIDEKEWENPRDYKGGWIYPGDSNMVEGFLIYEVPEDLNLDHAYVEGVFSSQGRAVWKLG